MIEDEKSAPSREANDANASARRANERRERDFVKRDSVCASRTVYRRVPATLARFSPRYRTPTGIIQRLGGTVSLEKYSQCVDVRLTSTHCTAHRRAGVRFFGRGEERSRRAAASRDRETHAHSHSAHTHTHTHTHCSSPLGSSQERGVFRLFHRVVLELFSGELRRGVEHRRRTRPTIPHDVIGG